MPSAPNVRSLSRLLAASNAAFWVITSGGKIAFVSSEAAKWLGIEPDILLDRQSIAGSPKSEDPADVLAASLSPPPGLSGSGFSLLLVQPPEVLGKSIAPQHVRFMQFGTDAEALTIAVAGAFPNSVIDPQLSDSITIRQTLDGWRKRHASIAVIATAGTSAAAKRLRGRLQIAAKLRTHLGFFGPYGSGAESIASRIHLLSAPGEPLVIVDGPLMDAELLEATISPAINQIAESSKSTASILVRGLDEMPIEAQSRLAEVVIGAASRIRLMGLCSPQPKLYCEPIASDKTLAPDIASTRVLVPRLAELLTVLHISIEPLSRRVEDLPLVAAALLDARHAAREGTAERFTRAAIDAMVKYPWPGDFAELDAAIRHAVRTSTADTIAAEHLPLVVRSYRAGAGSKREAKPIELDVAVRQFELRLIQDAVAAADGNRAEAARRLGISRTRLLRRLDESQQ